MSAAYEAHIMLVKAVFAGKEMISNKEPFLACKNRREFSYQNKSFQCHNVKFTMLLKNENLHILF